MFFFNIFLRKTLPRFSQYLILWYGVLFKIIFYLKISKIFFLYQSIKTIKKII